MNLALRTNDEPMRDALFLFILSASLCLGQGTVTREKPSGYPSRMNLASMELAAEYLVHSMPTPKGAIFTDDYLVVEVAVFPASRTPVTLHDSDFILRINGKRTLLPQSPGMVAGSLKYPDFQQRPRMEAEAGVGDGSVVLGRPPAVARFPGDPTARRTPLPRAPEPENPSGQTPVPDMPVEEICQRLSLPEESATGPRSGYLFFAFKGKTKGIRTIELLYEAGGVKAELKLL